MGLGYGTPTNFIPTIAAIAAHTAQGTTTTPAHKKSLSTGIQCMYLQALNTEERIITVDTNFCFVYLFFDMDLTFISLLIILKA